MTSPEAQSMKTVIIKYYCACEIRAHSGTRTHRLVCDHSECVCKLMPASNFTIIPVGLKTCVCAKSGMFSTCNQVSPFHIGRILQVELVGESFSLLCLFCFCCVSYFSSMTRNKNMLKVKTTYYYYFPLIWIKILL